jgi:hypothetical protein
VSTNYYAVESKDEDHWNGVFLGKRAGGWVFQFKWHSKSVCSTTCECPDGEYPYRNIDELREWLHQNGKIVKDEYGEILKPEEFLEMVDEWNEENFKFPEGRYSWEIDGYCFVRGNWS